MIIKGELIDKHFVHISEIRFGQVFVKQNNEICMKIQNQFVDEPEREFYAVTLKRGDMIKVDKEAKLRLLNCSLDIKGFVVK